MRFAPLGDAAVTVELGSELNAATLARVQGLVRALEQSPLVGVVDVVAAYGAVTVGYDLPKLPHGYAGLCAEIEQRIERLKTTAMNVLDAEAGKLVIIPVCYGGEFGPELTAVAARAGLSVEATVAAHSEVEYAVQAVGFAPGFPYLGGLPEKLHTPRLATPRTRVPAGSVGIGGAQTGVYPLATPGGWNLIGRTPLALFRPAEREPALLRVGDRVKFKAITAEEFAAWK
jgi:inhibitor of KinA